MNTFIEK